MDGSITNNGTIEPGSSPGRLNITGNLHLGATSRINLEIGGFGQSEFDTINVVGNTALSGALNVRLLDSFMNAMTNGASFTILTSGAPFVGAFANVASGSTLTAAGCRDAESARVIRIRDTLHLSDIFVSEAVLLVMRNLGLDASEPAGVESERP